MKLDIYKINGKKTAKKAELNSDVFGIAPNLHSIYLAVSSEMASLRQGTHSSKSKGEVSGTGAKPWKQKGTGRSRIGYLRNPSRVHGSKAFGPKPHSYKKKVNKKVKRLARRSVLSQRVIEKKLMIVEDFKIASFKTKEFINIVHNLNLHRKKITVLVGELTEDLLLSSRNIKNICVLPANSASTYDLLDNNYIVADIASIEFFNRELKV